MKITDCSMESLSDCVKIICPGCHGTDFRKYASYTRKGFHRLDISEMIVKHVPRYRCLNPECIRTTFSVLPPMVLPYSRFFWLDLLALKQILAVGSTPYHLAQHIWHVGRKVIVRAAALLDQLDTWIGELHQEVTDGGPVRKLEIMVKIITRKLGRIELAHRWYRHRYPLRFLCKTEHHTIRSFSVNRL